MTYVLLAVGLYAIVVMVMYTNQRRLMYVPGPPPPAPSALGFSEVAAVATRTEDGLRLMSWFAPASPGRPTVLYFHGNAGNFAHRETKLAPFLKARLGVVLAGYRGYNGNPGRPTEAGLYADARAAATGLAKRGVRPRDIVLYGESLGTGVATRLAAELAANGTPVRGVVLEAPYLSMAAAAQAQYPWLPAKWLVKDRFDNLARIGDIGAPLLIVHGRRDRIVPVGQGEALFAAAREPKQARWFDDAGHTDLFDHGADEAVLAFIAAQEPAEGAAPTP